MTARIDPDRIALLPRGEYAFPGPVRDQLVSAILRGDKTSTSSLVEEWQREGKLLPEVGRLELVIDSDGDAVCVTRAIAVSVVRLADIATSHAISEGEGFQDVAAWRVTHERFWTSADYTDAVGEPAIAIDDDTLVVCVSFEVAQRV